MSVRFTQSCPTCGRRIQFRASLMGCDVRCQHCDAVFVAQHDNAHPEKASQDAVLSQTADDYESELLMNRVQQALNRAEESAAIG
ncbi:MAG TPA: response regulator [Rhodopirellula sp.]|nr:response regulator [Rhodopirellula sp.]